MFSVSSQVLPLGKTEIKSCYCLFIYHSPGKRK